MLWCAAGGKKGWCVRGRGDPNFGRPPGRQAHNLVWDWSPSAGSSSASLVTHVHSNLTCGRKVAATGRARNPHTRSGKGGGAQRYSKFGDQNSNFFLAPKATKYFFGCTSWRQCAIVGSCCRENRFFFFIFFVDFCRLLPICTVLVHFDIALWERFWPFFRYFWDSLAFSGGPPQFISPILGQFWPFLTTFGSFLDYFWAEFFFAFFCRKMAFWSRNRRRILES